MMFAERFLAIRNPRLKWVLTQMIDMTMIEKMNESPTLSLALSLLQKRDKKNKKKKHGHVDNRKTLKREFRC
jgi:hypothetical protein